LAFITDTHCHLNLSPLAAKAYTFINNALEKGVTGILVPGLDVDSSESAISLQKKFPGHVYAAAGIHPNYSSDASEEDFSAIEKMASGKKVYAIGEIGLDFYRDFSQPQKQVLVFKRMLEIAREYQLPICIHNRDADEEIIQILDDWMEELTRMNNPLADLPGVFHSYNGSEKIYQWAVQHRFLLGISGPITFPKSSHLRKIVAEADINHLLIETDAPYLTPVPFRGRKNEPKNVIYIAEEIAKIKEINFELVAKTTSENAKRLFNWD